MRKRVVLIVPNLAGGGTERVVVHLLRHLDRQKVEPILMVIHLSGPYVTELPTDIQIVNLNVNRVRYAWPKLIIELNRLRPDCILSTMDYMNLAVLAGKMLLRGKPSVFIRESTPPSKALLILPTWKQKLFALLYRWLYPRADLIITQSEGMRNDLLSFEPAISADQVIKINNPIDIDKVQQKAAAFDPYGKQKRGLQIVAVGRLTYQKGFDLLLRAFQKVVHQGTDASLMILGEGGLRDELEKLAISLGIGERVTLAGFQQNPYPYVKQADLFVLSSRWEGFPNIVLEALACGTRVVATNCISGPDEILNVQDYAYGLLVEEGNVDALAEGMLSVLTQRQEFCPGLERARMFEASTIVKEYERLFVSAKQEGLG